jgi:Fe-S cluster assembly protein SufD
LIFTLQSCHLAPNTYSNIITKGAIFDSSKALSRGLVRIEKPSFNSNGYETQEALLLSERAEADAIPNLEIYNHDVKCSHGSTIGRLDKEKMFYLMSRGLTKDQAKIKLIEGFFVPAFDKIPDIKLKEKLLEKISLVLK